MLKSPFALTLALETFGCFRHIMIGEDYWHTRGGNASLLGRAET